jgi:hypothetical protein
MKLLALVKNPLSTARYLAAVGELTEVLDRSPPRTPPYGKSQVLRRLALSDEAEGADPDRGHEATRQRSKRTESSEFRRGGGAPRTAGVLARPQLPRR